MNTNLIYTKIRVAGAAAADGQQDEERAGGRGHPRVRRRRPTNHGQVLPEFGVLSVRSVGVCVVECVECVERACVCVWYSVLSV